MEQVVRNGLIASYEKFIIDCEMLQHIARYLEPVIYNTNEESLAFSAVGEVGHSGHFFGATHAQERLSKH